MLCLRRRDALNTMHTVLVFECAVSVVVVVVVVVLVGKRKEKQLDSNVTHQPRPHRIRTRRNRRRWPRLSRHHHRRIVGNSMTSQFPTPSLSVLTIHLENLLCEQTCLRYLPHQPELPISHHNRPQSFFGTLRFNEIRLHEPNHFRTSPCPEMNNSLNK